MPFRPRSTLTAVVVLAATFLAACGGGGDGAGEETPEASGPPAAATVNLQPATFDPADVSIAVGETVAWKWNGGVKHDVEGEGFKSKVQSTGTFTYTFAKAGTFDYKCNIHPTTMKGTVTVE